MISCDYAKAVQELHKGNVIAYRTDTVYGLSTNITNSRAVSKIFRLKRRNDGKPLIVLVPCGYDISKLVFVSPNAQKLIDALWPGPLTIIFKLKGKVACGITPFDTLSLRMPGDERSKKLLSLYGEPITSTSCNISGEKILDNAQDIDQVFDIFTLDGGKCTFGVPSTLVDCSSDNIKIIREGSITAKQIYEIINK